MQGKDQRPKTENKTRTRTKTKTNTNRAQDQDQHQKDKDKEKQQGRHADTNRKEARTATTIRRPRAHKTSSGLQHKTRDKKLKKKIARKDKRTQVTFEAATHDDKPDDETTTLFTLEGKTRETIKKESTNQRKTTKWFTKMGETRKRKTTMAQMTETNDDTHTTQQPANPHATTHTTIRQEKQTMNNPQTQNTKQRPTLTPQK
jgi:hypothetical protein